MKAETSFVRRCNTHDYALARALAFALITIPIDAAAQKVDVVLATPAVRPGAPLEVEITISAAQDGMPRATVFWLDARHISARLLDAKGAPAAPVRAPEYGSVDEGRWLARAQDQGPQFMKQTLVLNRWVSTQLPPGSYRLQLEATASCSRPIEDSVDSTKTYWSPPVRVELPLKVLERDDAAVTAIYAASAAAWGESEPARVLAAERLVDVREPLALPYQLQLFRGGWQLWQPSPTGWDLLDLALHYIAHPRIEFTKCMVDWMSEPRHFADDFDENWMREMVLWTVHQLHKTGDPETVKRTTPVVAAHPEPTDPRLFSGL